MLPLESQIYLPALRLKQGEYKALAELQSDLAAQILPHFIIPPPRERDPEKGRALTFDEIVHEAGRRVGRHWPLRPCLLDPRFLFGELYDSECVMWLPRLFKVATSAGSLAIPVVSLSDLEGARLAAFSAILSPQSAGIALRITLRNLGDPGLPTRVQSALLRAGTKPNECLLLLDFSGADLSEPQMVADYILTAYQQVNEIGLWGRLAVQATSFPEKNPSEAGGNSLLPRNEWHAWKHAANHEDNVRRNVMFGDFGADSSKFIFASGGRSPIRHYRYSTTESWFVVRGTDEHPVKEAMQDISLKIVNSDHFSGREFSHGDAFIYDTAHGLAGPGNPSTWRKVNTVHHLTRVVCDLAPLHGRKIWIGSSVPAAEQLSLFDR
jgi:hypothetical protein